MLKISKIFLLKLLFISFFSFSQESKIEEQKDFGENKGNLKMFVFNPFSSNDTLPKNLIIALHGCNQNAAEFDELTGLTNLAKDHNTIVIFPQQKTINNITQCFNWFNEKDFTLNSGENSSIMEMYHFAVNKYNIDKSKIFLFGVSSGAAMSIAVAITNPTSFKGVCSYAGVAYGIVKTPFDFMKQINGNFTNIDEKIKKSIQDLPEIDDDTFPILITIHGKKDKIVDSKNSTYIQLQWKEYFFKNKEINTINVDVNNSDITKTIIYKETKPIQFDYQIENLGHKYLVDPNNNYGGKLNNSSKDINFYATFHILKDFGIIKD